MRLQKHQKKGWALFLLPLRLTPCTPSLYNSLRHFLLEGQSDRLLPGYGHLSEGVLAQAKGLEMESTSLPGTRRSPGLSEPWLPGQPTAQHSVARLQPRTHPWQGQTTARKGGDGYLLSKFGGSGQDMGLGSIFPFPGGLCLAKPSSQPGRVGHHCATVCFLNYTRG